MIVFIEFTTLGRMRTRHTRIAKLIGERWTMQLLNAPNGSSRDTDNLVAPCARLHSYQQTSSQTDCRKTSRDARVVADELEVRRRRCLVLGLSVEDNAWT